MHTNTDRKSIILSLATHSVSLLFAGETDWKILAIDVADPLAEKLNGEEELWKWVDRCTT